MSEFELNNNFKENVFEHFEDGNSNFLPSVEQSMQFGQLISQGITSANQIYQNVKPRKKNEQLAKQMEQQIIAQQQQAQQQAQQQRAKEQQMYSLLAQAKEKNTEKSKNKNKLIIGLSIGGSVLLLATILIIYIKRKK
jgi:chemotaxis response regulator CheB